MGTDHRQSRTNQRAGFMAKRDVIDLQPATFGFVAVNSYFPSSAHARRLVNNDCRKPSFDIASQFVITIKGDKIRTALNNDHKSCRSKA